MSLVGTRPPTLDEWEKYEPHHRARMSFRPGLTGLWQVSGRSNITDFEEVVKLDTQYIGEWSVKGLSFFKKILRYFKKKCPDRIKRIVLRKPESDLNMAFHYLGNNCKLCNCDFGNDLKLISMVL